MSYQEKNIYVSILITFLVYGGFCLWAFFALQQGRFEGEAGAQLVGKSFFVLFGIAIVFSIALRIAFHIIHAIITREPKPSFVVDERDQLIELQGLQVFLYVLSGGFMLSMAALAFGQPAALVFFLIISSFSIGDLAGNARRICKYRAVG